MKDKKTSVMIILLILAMLGIFYVYQTSYAKYKKSIDGNMRMNMARWQILVNDEDIKNKKTLTNDLTPVFNGNEYIESSVIAPGASGYFDIEIDPNNTDVAFNYEISITENTAYPDIKLDGYEINPSSTPNKSPLVNNKVSGNVAKGGSAFTIRVYVLWYDESDNSMDNSTDTNLAVDNTALTYQVNLKFIQTNGA